jgi:hypothetical protein
VISVAPKTPLEESGSNFHQAAYGNAWANFAGERGCSLRADECVAKAADTWLTTGKSGMVYHSVRRRRRTPCTDGKAYPRHEASPIDKLYQE